MREPTELNRSTYTSIKDAIDRQEPLLFWLYARDVTGMDGLTEDWVQRPLAPILDRAELSKALKYAPTNVDAYLTMIVVRVEQGGQQGIVEYRSGHNQTVEVRIGWPEEKPNNL